MTEGKKEMINRKIAELANKMDTLELTDDHVNNN